MLHIASRAWEEYRGHAGQGKRRRLPDIDVLARGFLRRGLSQHPDVAQHVADTNDIENMSTWELLNLAKTMGVDPAAMIRSLEQEDDKLWDRRPGPGE